MKILSIGQFSYAGLSNTCLHRNWALKKIGDVTEVDSTLTQLYLGYRIVNYMFVKLNFPIRYYFKKLDKKILKCIENEQYDVIWIDKGIFISPNTFQQIRKKQTMCKIIGYSPDNMLLRHNQTQLFLDTLKYYDYYITTKSYIVDGLKDIGGRNIIFVNNAYEPTFHHKYEITQKEKELLGGEIGFIGMWEEERCNSILYLAENGLNVRVWGGGKWLAYENMYPNLKIEKKGLYTEEYNKAISAFDISLCFLRKANFDRQTTRSIEIPACGSLLMAERTREHECLFKDGEEAVFFSSNEELLEKCKYYMNHKEKLKQIAEAGKRKCETAGYSNEHMIRNILKKVGLL